MSLPTTPGSPALPISCRNAPADMCDVRNSQFPELPRGRLSPVGFVRIALLHSMAISNLRDRLARGSNSPPTYHPFGHSGERTCSISREAVRQSRKACPSSLEAYGSPRPGLGSPPGKGTIYTVGARLCVGRESRTGRGHVVITPSFVPTRMRGSVPSLLMVYSNG